MGTSKVSHTGPLTFKNDPIPAYQGRYAVNDKCSRPFEATNIHFVLKYTFVM